MSEIAQSSVKEGLVNRAATRASLCNCLPGYIPSTGGSLNGGTIYNVPAWGKLVYIPTGTRTLYIVDPNNNCGISMDATYPKSYDWARSNNISSESELTIKHLTCDVLENTSTGGGNYFCQKLGDPAVTRKCY